MKSLLSLILLPCAALLIAAPADPHSKQDDLQLPELDKVMRTTLSPSYSCRSEEEFQKGYGNTALFLSAYSRKRNSPELVFNGACKSEDSFRGQTAGDDLDVITDYSDVPLTDLTAEHVFSPRRTTDSMASFGSRSRTQIGHTYGVLINKNEIRGFFCFKVIAYVPNKSVELEYVVLDYEILSVAGRSPGFAWDRKISY